MDYYSGYITKLIEELSGLPGIGPKTAGRLAFHILDMPKEQVESLANSMIDAKKNVRYCKCCYTLTDQDICPICSSKERDHKTIMVVETTKDMAAYEKIGEYKGVYHILHGAINPMAGIGQNDIKLKELFERRRLAQRRASVDHHLDAGPGQHAAALRRRWPHDEHRSRDELYRSCHQSDRTGADGHKFQRRRDPWINKKTSAQRNAEVFFASSRLLRGAN